MHDLKFISDEQFREAQSAPLVVRQGLREVLPTHAEFVAEMARQVVFDAYGEETYTKGLTVWTTVRRADQDAAYAAVLANDPPEALPLIELDLSKLPKGTPKIASYDVKFDESTDAYKKTKSGPVHDLDEDVVAEIQRVAVTAFRALHLRDYARIDLRLGANGRIYLIEANPNPWLDPIAEFAMAAKESGRSYTQMIDAIVKAAVGRRR